MYLLENKNSEIIVILVCEYNSGSWWRTGRRASWVCMLLVKTQMQIYFARWHADYLHAELFRLSIFKWQTWHNYVPIVRLKDTCITQALFLMALCLLTYRIIFYIQTWYCKSVAWFLNFCMIIYLEILQDWQILRKKYDSVVFQNFLRKPYKKLKETSDKFMEKLSTTKTGFDN